MNSRIQDRENRVTALIAALRASGEPAQHDLAGRLWRCQMGRADRRRGVQHRWPPVCRSAACEFCRRRLIRRGCSRAAERMAPATSGDCSLITVMLSRCRGLADMLDVIGAFRVELRNWRDRRARVDGRWRSLEMVGQVEIEALDPGAIHLLPPSRRAVVEALPGRSGTDGYARHDQAVVWVGHVHLVCHAPDLDGGELRDALERQWPGPAGRVDVRSFHPGSAAENTAAIFGYANKNKMETALRDGIKEKWPMAVQAAYWGWLHEIGNGLATLRIRLGPKKVRVPRVPRMRLAADASTTAPATVC